jgi:hypothetical protein
MIEAEAKVSTKLQEVVEQLLNDQRSSDELVEALDETRGRLLELERQFTDSLDSEAEGARLAVQSEVLAVQQSFSDYYAVLSTLDGYLGEFDMEFLEDAHKNLPLVIERLNLDFWRYREAMMAERGPSTHPGINHLLGLAGDERLVADGSVSEALEQQRELELIRVDSGIESLATDDESGQLGPAVRRFLDQYSELLNDEDFGSQDWQNKLRELGSSYSRIDLNFLARRYGHGPTAVSQINLVINTAWLFLQNSVDREVVAYYLEQAELSLQQILAGHLQMQRSLSDEDRHAEDANLVADGCEDMLAVIESYWAWLDSPDDKTLHELFVRASQAAKYVEEGFRALGSVEADTLNCSICGSSNRPDLSRCRTCGAALSGAVEASFSLVEGGGPVADESPLGAAVRFQTVLGLAEQILQKQADPESLLEECDQLTIALDLAKKSNRDAQSVQTKSDEEQELVLGASEDYGRAMSEMADAIASLRTFAEDPSVEGFEHSRNLLTSVAERLSGVQEQLAPLTQR